MKSEVINLNRKFTLLSILLILIFPIFYFASGNILLINSYNEGVKWSDEIVRGVMEKINESEVEGVMEYGVFAEYLDSKRLFSEESYDVFRSILEIKYEKIKFDLIMVSDNNALSFINMNYHRLFSDIPVVFCGINGYEKSMTENIDNLSTGISEKSDIYDTIYWAIKQNPDAESFYVFLDTLSETGILIKKDFIEQISRIKGINIIMKENRNLMEASEEIKKIPKESFAIILTWFSNPEDVSIFSEKSIKYLTDNSEVPIYAIWKPFIGNGIAGGKMNDPNAIGRKMAEISLSVLSGSRVEDIPVSSYDLNEFVYDYEVLEKYGIPVKNVPDNSEIFNEPVNIFVEYSAVFTVITIIGLFLFAVIVMLFYNNFKTRKVKDQLIEKNKNLEELNEELVAYEEELSASNEELNRQYVELEKNKEEIEETGKTLVNINRELILNRNRFQALFKRTPLAMIIWDERKRILEWNESAQRIFHWTAEEVKGKNFLEFMVPESSLRNVKEKIEGIRNSEIIELINENFTKEGEVLVCEWKTAVVKDENEKIIETISLGQDITRKYKSEIILRKRYDTEKLISHLSTAFMRNKNFKETLQDSLEKVVNFSNTEIGIFVYFGKAESEKYFYPDAAENKDNLNLIKMEWFENLFKFLDYHIIYDVSNSKIISGEFKDYLGSLGIKSLITILVDVGKEKKGVLIFARKDNDIDVEKEDITILKIFSDILTRVLERRSFEEILILEREKAIRAEIEKDGIINSIGHRIRTPMNGIIGLNKVLSQTELSGEQREISDMITDSSRQLMEVVKELFDFGRSEVKKLEDNR